MGARVNRQFLTRDQLTDRAIEQTGLHHFGDDFGWQEALDRLLDALDGQRFMPGAIERIEGRLVSVLTARLEVEAWLREHPDDEHGEIEGPVVIIGLPRTATTALLNLMAVDDTWRFVRAWEADRPVPPPTTSSEPDDARAAAERERLANDVTFAGMHIHQAGGPVDDASLLRLGGRNQELGLPAFDYTRWWRDCDMSQTYRYHHRMLRLMQRHRPPNRWLIKAPWHNFHLDELIAEYPNARFIMTHRDPARLVPSVSSLVYTAFATYQPPEAIDRAALGRFMLEHLQISVDRMMDFRRRHGDERFIDIHHGPFNEHPLDEVSRIYNELGMSLTEDARRHMSAWASQNRKGAHGEHRYRAEDFGCQTGEISEAFRTYIDQYKPR
jgi:hypothetical protein